MPKKNNEPRVMLTTVPGWEPVMPIGPAYLKGYLESNGFGTKIIDLNVEFTEELFIAGNDYRKKRKILDKAYFRLKKELISYDPDVIGFSLHEPTFLNGVYLVKKVKSDFRKNILTVVGGPHISYLKSRVLDFKSIDIAVTGEGEIPLLNLMQRIKNGRDIQSPAYYSRKNGKIVGGDAPKYIENLDEIPFPDFSDLKFDRYPFPFIISLFSRGCTKKCIFCGEPYVYSCYRFRTVDNIIQEVKRNTDEYGFKILAFTDALANANPTLLNKICNKIIDKKLDINWMAQIHPSLTDSQCKIMYKSGARLFYIAPETGSQRVADILKKNVNIKTTEESLQRVHNNGIKSSVWYIIGFPFETSDDIRETFDFMEKTKEYSEEILVSPFGLSINTPMYFNPQKFGITSVKERGYHLYCTYETNKPEFSFQNQMRVLLELYKKNNPEAYNSKMINLVRQILDDEEASADEKFLLTESFQFPYKLYGVKYNEDYSYINLFQECFKDILTDFNSSY